MITSSTARPVAVPDVGALLHEMRQRFGRQHALWVFGYASLIWRPEFDAQERRPARVQGWHRALRMRSHINRGTPECPGLVFALLSGGACRGEVHRLPDGDPQAEMERLWAREMLNAVYTPRWLACHTPEGTVPALAFTLDRRHEACLAPMDDQKMVNVLRNACGRYGTTLDYLARTAEALRARGIRDREIERLMSLARRHRLLTEPGG